MYQWWKDYVYPINFALSIVKLFNNFVIVVTGDKRGVAPAIHVKAMPSIVHHVATDTTSW